MVASHRSIIAGAVLFVAGATGASADYYGGMKDAPVTVMPASWYVRGDASYAWTDAGELSGAIPPSAPSPSTTPGRSAAASAATSAAASAAT